VARKMRDIMSSAPVCVAATVVREGIPVGMISVGDLAPEADQRSALSQIPAAPPNV
jgi:hypothetical protein